MGIYQHYDGKFGSDLITEHNFGGGVVASVDFKKNQMGLVIGLIPFCSQFRA